jgi:lariat debranching enzyme
VRFGSLHIAALSGIFDAADYPSIVDERFPLRADRDLRSAVHYRAFSFFQLSALRHADIIVSHDWPAKTISLFGSETLKRRKPHLLESDAAGQFGIRYGLRLRERLRPRHWFAAHHHCKFAASIDGTEFLALAKPGVGGGNLWSEVVEVEGAVGDGVLRYSGEWIEILRATREEMEVPGLLAGNEWEERIARARERMQECPDAEVGEAEPDPVVATVNFCKRFGIFCPNPEIRAVMAPVE